MNDKAALPHDLIVGESLYDYAFRVMNERDSLRSQLSEIKSHQHHLDDIGIPDVCPITGYPFFMWITHHETGKWMPTYGGPYDSYTIPVKDEHGYYRERYDHDEGGWLVDEYEDVGLTVVDDQIYTSEDDPKELRQQLSEVMAQRDALISAGTKMSNACFNMAQWADLPKGQPEILKAMQVKWDEAVRKVPAQSLTEIKAQAIEEAITDYRKEYVGQGIEDWLNGFSDRLRQQGKG